MLFFGEIREKLPNTFAVCLIPTKWVYNWMIPWWTLKAQRTFWYTVGGPTPQSVHLAISPYFFFWWLGSLSFGTFESKNSSKYAPTNLKLVTHHSSDFFCSPPANVANGSLAGTENLTVQQSQWLKEKWKSVTWLVKTIHHVIGSTAWDPSGFFAETWGDVRIATFELSFRNLTKNSKKLVFNCDRIWSEVNFWKLIGELHSGVLVTGSMWTCCSQTLATNSYHLCLKKIQRVGPTKTAKSTRHELKFLVGCGDIGVSTQIMSLTIK